MTAASQKDNRIVSLDQFRGYTVAGMFLVNFMGGFAACPLILKHHHDYISYADTIMPHFLFAVGFAFRLTFGRRVQAQGQASAYLRIVRRLLGLVLVSLVIYHVPQRAESWSELVDTGLWGVIVDPLKRHWFQTLMHIAVTSLWILLVIQSTAAVRILFMITSAAAHLFFSYWFYFTWVNSPPNAIDGGPLSFLTWTIPAIMGTLVCDWVVAAEGNSHIKKIAFWAVGLMFFGWIISCGTRLYDVPLDQIDALKGQRLAVDPVLPQSVKFEDRSLGGLLAEPPFVPPPGEDYRKWNYWMMSQRGGTLSYLTFAAGFSMAVYLLFYLACDRYSWRLNMFQTFGSNALIAYILHELVDGAVSPFVPRDAPWWYAWGGFLLFFAIVWLIIRHLEKNKIYLRI